MIEIAFFKGVGMYYTSCKPIVEKQLKDQQSIKKIEVNYMTDSVIVEFDSERSSKEKIKERLERSGYKFTRLAR